MPLAKEESPDGRSGTTVHLKFQYGSAHLPLASVREVPLDADDVSNPHTFSKGVAEEATRWMEQPGPPTLSEDAATTANSSGESYFSSTFLTKAHTVLVVDDNADMRVSALLFFPSPSPPPSISQPLLPKSYISSILGKYATTITAEDGLRGLEIAQTIAVDLIIS